MLFYFLQRQFRLGYKELEILVQNFLSTLLGLLLHMCTTNKCLLRKTFYSNWATKCTLNEPSLFTKHANKVQIKQMLITTCKLIFRFCRSNILLKEKIHNPYETKTALIMLSRNIFHSVLFVAWLVSFYKHISMDMLMQ